MKKWMVFAGIGLLVAVLALVLLLPRGGNSVDALEVCQGTLPPADADPNSVVFVPCDTVPTSQGSVAPVPSQAPQTPDSAPEPSEGGEGASPEVVASEAPSAPVTAEGAVSFADGQTTIALPDGTELPIVPINLPELPNPAFDDEALRIIGLSIEGAQDMMGWEGEIDFKNVQTLGNYSFWSLDDGKYVITDNIYLTLVGVASDNGFSPMDLENVTLQSVAIPQAVNGLSAITFLELNNEG